MRRRVFPWLTTVLVSIAGGALAQAPPLPSAAPPAQAVTRAEAISLALQHNPALQEAQGRVTTAQGRVAEAQSAQGLQLNALSSYNYVNKLPSFSFPGAPPVSLGNHDTWVTTLAAQQVLYSNGRLQALVRQASGAARASEALATRTRQQVAFAAERAFLILVAAQRQEQVAQSALTAAEEHLRVAQARYEERAAAQFDVLRAQVQAEESRQDLLNARVDTAVAQANLAQVVGLADRAFTAVDAEPLSAPVAPALEQALAEALATRPELTAANWQVQSARAGLTAARAERGPTLALGANYQHVSPESPLSFTEWTAALQVSLPLLEGGRIRARVREAEGQQLQAESARQTLTNAVTDEVRTAHAQLAAAENQVAVARRRVELAQETLRIAEVRYQAAVATPTEVTDAEAALTRAQQGLTQAAIGQAIAAASLDLAMGATKTEVAAPESAR